MVGLGDPTQPRVWRDSCNGWMILHICQPLRQAAYIQLFAAVEPQVATQPRLEVLALNARFQHGFAGAVERRFRNSVRSIGRSRIERAQSLAARQEPYDARAGLRIASVELGRPPCRIEFHDVIDLLLPEVSIDVREH